MKEGSHDKHKDEHSRTHVDSVDFGTSGERENANLGANKACFHGMRPSIAFCIRP